MLKSSEWMWYRPSMTTTRAERSIHTLLTMATVSGCLGLAACAYQPVASPPSQPVTLSWAASDDARTQPITYNVYAVPGAGPIPTMRSDACGMATLANLRPLNRVPINATTYSTGVAAGLWTFAIEAVSSDGCRSALSPSITVTVPSGPNSSTNVSIGP